MLQLGDKDGEEGGLVGSKRAVRPGGIGPNGRDMSHQGSLCVRGKILGPSGLMNLCRGRTGREGGRRRGGAKGEGKRQNL